MTQRFQYAVLIDRLIDFSVIAFCHAEIFRAFMLHKVGFCSMRVGQTFKLVVAFKKTRRQRDFLQNRGKLSNCVLYLAHFIPPPINGKPSSISSAVLR